MKILLDIFDWLEAKLIGIYNWFWGIKTRNRWPKYVLEAITPMYRHRYGYRPRPQRSLFGATEFSRCLQATKLHWGRLGRRKRPVLPCFFGKPSSGEVVTRDFIDIRQCLITGVQGSGKTTALHTMIASMMYLTKDMFRLHVFDFKKDLWFYKNLCNYHTKAGTFAKKLEDLFKKDMAKINRDLARSKSQNIFDENEKRHKKGGKRLLKYNIIIIDEYGGLNNEEVEKWMLKISQMGRSAGFFIILITQRADANALNSGIKANVVNNYTFMQRDGVNERVAGVVGASKLFKQGQGLLGIDTRSVMVQTPTFQKGYLRSVFDKYTQLYVQSQGRLFNFK